MRLLAGVHQVVLLQVSQLGEAFAAGLTLEGPFSAVDPKVNLRVEEEEEESLGFRPSETPAVSCSRASPSGWTAVQTSCCTRCTRT